MAKRLFEAKSACLVRNLGQCGILKAWAWIMPSARRASWPRHAGRADRPGRHLLEDVYVL